MTAVSHTHSHNAPPPLSRRRMMRSKTMRAFRALRALRPQAALKLLPHVRTFRVINAANPGALLRSLRVASRVLMDTGRGRKRQVLRRLITATVSTAAALTLGPLSYLLAMLWPTGAVAAGSATTIDAIGNVPANAMSRWLGRFTESERVPYRVHQYLIRAVIHTYGIDISQVERPLSHYRTLQEFFSRRLVPGARPPHPHSALVSPCDGEILQLGRVTGDDMIVQVKGDSYALRELLQSSPSTAFGPCAAGMSRWFFLFHLRPKDYHRFHAPCDLTVDEAVHIPGTLHPVTNTANKWIPGLFARNERVSVLGRWQYGRIGFVPVGATCVGSISLAFDQRIRTNTCSSLTNIVSLFRFANGTDTSLVDGPAVEVIAARDEALRKLAAQHNRPFKDLFQSPDTRTFRYGSDQQAPLAISPACTEGAPAASPATVAPQLQKGDEMGWFGWGSAIAIIVDVPENTGAMVRPLDEVRVGDPLFSW